MRPVHLTLRGRPKPGERAGTTPEGKRYSQPNTKAVKGEVGMLWIAAGSPPMIPGPVAVRIRAVYARPGHHFRQELDKFQGGGLSAAGLRSDFPTSARADLDNLAKPILDGLSGLAWADDHQVCELTISKVWDDGRGPRTDVWISAMVAVEFAPEDVAA